MLVFHTSLFRLSGMYPVHWARARRETACAAEGREEKGKIPGILKSIPGKIMKGSD